MGPILFNIFLNDLLWVIQSKCVMFNYADDNTIVCSDKDPKIVQNTLEEACHISIQCFKDNYMKANAKKFQAMVLSRNYCDINIKIEN